LTFDVVLANVDGFDMIHGSLATLQLFGTNCAGEIAGNVAVLDEVSELFVVEVRETWDSFETIVENIYKIVNRSNESKCMSLEGLSSLVCG
jgi:hypothetical protein